MGKTTLYHPVSLHVIRGAAEYCGLRFTKIVQTTNDPELGTAAYEAQVDPHSPLIDHCGIRELRERVNSCFARDITCTDWRFSKAGKLVVTLSIDVNREKKG